MREYELILVLSPTTTEEKQEKVRENISKILKEVSGKVKKHDLWQKRSLAYPIARQKEAIFLILNIEAEVITPNISQKLKLIDGVMRYLLLNKGVKEI